MYKVSDYLTPGCIVTISGWAYTCTHQFTEHYFTVKNEINGSLKKLSKTSIEQVQTSDEFGNTFDITAHKKMYRNKFGQLHRLDGPAVLYDNDRGTQFWIDGKIYPEDHFKMIVFSLYKKKV